MACLTIAPLATKDSITADCKVAVVKADKLFLQTKLHPSSKWVLDAGLAFRDMDDLYDASFDFDELNESIADRLISVCAELPGDKSVVYAVTSRAEMTALFELLGKKARECGVKLRLLPSCGYFESAFMSLDEQFDTNGIMICSATSIPECINPRLPVCIEEIDTVIRAGEVKLRLLEFYPDEFPVNLCVMDENGDFHSRTIQLFELDREKDFFAATTLIIRAAKLTELKRHSVDSLIDVMQTLRAPGGCPWDAEQTHKSLRPSLIEESYEVLDALDRDDARALCEELGDLLLQIVFHAQIENELRSFDMRDVCTGIVEKLIYRHPHVFGDVTVSNSDDVLKNWESLKQKEKRQETVGDAMHAVPQSFPALMYAEKIQKKAAHVGFDWSNARDAMKKIVEEFNELAQAISAGEGEARVREELGDLLFSVVNVARLLKCEPEIVLREASVKFMDRFCRMEQLMLDEGVDMRKLHLSEMDVFWDRVK